MSIAAYRSLIDKICVLTNIPDPALMYGSASLQVNGVNFSLFEGGVIAPDSVMVYCDFGELPPRNREAVLLRLLETNLYLFGDKSPAFTYNIENQHIVLACRMPLAQATAEKVLDLLAHYAGMAKEWRKTYYLLHQEEKSGALARPVLKAVQGTRGRGASQFQHPGESRNSAHTPT